MSLKHQQRGQDHTFSIKDVGRDVRITVSEHGYRLKVSAEIKFDALTDKQALASRDILHNAIDTALRTSSMQRRVNVPLFDIEPAQQPTTAGVNEL